MNNRGIGAWITVIACSYFAFTLYWLTRSARFSLNRLPNLNVSGNTLSATFGLTIMLAVAVFLSEIGGLAIRFIGAVNAVSASYNVWRKGTDSLASVKGRISNAIFCEGLYWGLFILPILNLSLNATGRIDYITIMFLAASFSLQIILIAPFLIALSFKFRRSNFGLNAIAKSRLFWISCINYIIALYASYNLRWLEVIVYRGIGGLFIENTFIGFANSAITLFLAIVLTLVAAWPVLKKRGSPNLKWLGLALTFLGLHFLIHILYTAYTGVLANALEYRLKFMLMIDVWPVAFLGLGLYLGRHNSRASDEVLKGEHKNETIFSDLSTILSKSRRVES